MTGAFGIKRFFGVSDVNWAWTDLEKLEDPVRTRVLSLRLGRAFKVGSQNPVSFWAGRARGRATEEAERRPG